MNKTMIIALGLSSTLLASGAMAQTAGAGWANRMGPAAGYTQGMMGRLPMNDANEDGRVSAEEAAAAADEVFAAMDADADGQITRDEYMTVRMGPGIGWDAERQSLMQKDKEDRFSNMDPDGNGMVTRAEFLAAAEAHHKAADSDGDGIVTPWEQRRGLWY